MKCQMSREALVLLFFFFFVRCVCGGESSERRALLELKRGVSDPDGVLSAWNASDLRRRGHCSWPGVACDSAGRVVALRIAAAERRGNGSEALSCSLSYTTRNVGVGSGGLGGEISPWVGRLESLRVLSLPYNGLFGRIPEEIWGLEGLEVLDLEGNSLAGELPVRFGGLRRLRILNLGLNGLRGEIPIGLSSCRDLKVLNLAGNEFTGAIPGFLGDNCESLEHLDLSGNSLTGEIPRELGKLRSLKALVVSGNRLAGPIPVELGECVGMSVLVLSNGERSDKNRFEGSIPEEVTTLPGLKMVWAPKAGLEGKVPGNWGSCEDLEMVNLAQNGFGGEVLGVFEKCKKLSYLDLSLNKLTGKLDGNLRVPCMTVFNVSGNLLSGPIPRFKDRACSTTASSSDPFRAYKSFFACKTRLEIKSPMDSASLAVIRDLSGNRFSGPTRSLLPKLAGLFSESVFRKCDRLSGMIMNGQIPRKIGSNNNPRRDRVLISLAVQSKDQEDNINLDSESSDGLNSIEIASVASASAIVMVLLALIVLFFYTRKWAPDFRVQGLELREITVFGNVDAPLTFEGIVRSTGNFNASNCIGNGGFGSTFKSEIQPGVIVAVKRLSVGRFQQGIQQFHAEVKTLGRVRHPNLVTLLGYHASETEMFLIYNYLPGGNLEKFIKERSSRASDWKILHRIALDIANALAYLHDQCVPRVLHRDVKPSNILLDNDLKAYLSDFGLSRLLGTSETHATTGVAGTFGYLAPEYAMTCRVSDKSDVYSYGVVLLELISDKRPLDPSFSSHGDGFNIVTWASLLLKQGRGKEVFTVGLWDSGPHDDLVEMLHLAVTCTNETLSIRPTMKHVVQRLKRIKPVSLGS